MSFADQVYALCRQIPKGKITTYKAIAEALGTKAYRAVGNALNKNPYAPNVPCHRVVASSGHVQGFAQGLKEKERLLKSEGIGIKKKKVLHLEKVLYRFV